MTHIIQCVFRVVCPGLIIEYMVTIEESVSLWLPFGDCEGPVPCISPPFLPCTHIMF